MSRAKKLHWRAMATVTCAVVLLAVGLTACGDDGGGADTANAALAEANAANSEAATALTDAQAASAAAEAALRDAEAELRDVPAEVRRGGICNLLPPAGACSAAARRRGPANAVMSLDQGSRSSTAIRASGRLSGATVSPAPSLVTLW